MNRNVGRKVLYAVPILALLYYMIPFTVEIEIHEYESEDGAVIGDEEDEEEDEELVGLFFLPLTWPKKMPRMFYKGSDPEWQEYIKFNKDKAKQKDICSMFTKTVVVSVVTNVLKAKQCVAFENLAQSPQISTR